MPGLWRTLRDNLTGSFTARARGFTGDEFVLSDGAGEERGWLKIMGSKGARLTAGDLEVLVNRAPDSRYAMLSGHEEVLSAQPAGASSADKLEVWCEGRSYTADISLFRNRTTVWNETGAEAARIAGNVTGRSYRVDTAVEDPCAPPVAVLLVYHMAFSRRRAYRAAFGKR